MRALLIYLLAFSSQFSPLPNLYALEGTTVKNAAGPLSSLRGESQGQTCAEK